MYAYTYTYVLTSTKGVPGETHETLQQLGTEAQGCHLFDTFSCRSQSVSQINEFRMSETSMGLKLVFASFFVRRRVSSIELMSICSGKVALTNKLLTSACCFISSKPLEN